MGRNYVYIYGQQITGNNGYFVRLYCIGEVNSNHQNYFYHRLFMESSDSYNKGTYIIYHVLVCK